MPEAPYAELDYKKNLKLDLFPTIWCPGCGIGTIMMQLAMVLDEMAMDESNTIVVTGIGCTGRMGGYMKYEIGLHAPRPDAAGGRGDQDGAAGDARHRGGR